MKHMMWIMMSSHMVRVRRWSLQKCAVQLSWMTHFVTRSLTSTKRWIVTCRNCTDILTLTLHGCGSSSSGSSSSLKQRYECARHPSLDSTRKPHLCHSNVDERCGVTMRQQLARLKAARPNAATDVASANVEVSDNDNDIDDIEPSDDYDNAWRDVGLLSRAALPIPDTDARIQLLQKLGASRKTASKLVKRCSTALTHRTVATDVFVIFVVAQ